MAAAFRRQDLCQLGRPGQEIAAGRFVHRSEEHTSELQSQSNLVCRLLLEKKKKNRNFNQKFHRENNRRSKERRTRSTKGSRRLMNTRSRSTYSVVCVRVMEDIDVMGKSM